MSIAQYPGAAGGGGTGLTDTQLRATPVPIDVNDRAVRLLGIVASITAAVDVSDRAGRLLGTIANTAFDVTDRAARLIGKASIADSTGATSAPVSTTVPAGTEAGLYVRVVSAPAGGGGGGPADVGATTAASESDATRQKVTSALRLLDTTLGAGLQLVAAKGDSTSGMWVNVKAAVGQDVTDRAGRALGSIANTAFDVTDRAARLLGIVDKGKLWDGTNIATVKAGVIAAVGDNPLVVTVHPSSAPTTAQPVTGTFFQATQPVSLAAAVDVSDRSARLLGTIANTAFDVTDRAARLLGIVYGSVGQLTQKAASTLALATDTALVMQHSPQDARAATLCVTGTAAAGTGVTVTLPAPAAGLFHYITRINIVKYASVATVGAAAPIVVTSTNLPGAVAWTTPTALAIGTQYETDVEPKSPIKSSVAAIATTIVAPLTASIIWRVTAYYYTAP